MPAHPAVDRTSTFSALRPFAEPASEEGISGRLRSKILIGYEKNGERSVCPQVFPSRSTVQDFTLCRSRFNRFAHANRKFPCSTRSGVTCPYFSRCRRQ